MKKKFFSIIKILFGNLLLAISVQYTVLPYNILSGGVAGIALIFEKSFGINTNLCIDILIATTFILGCIFLGKEFAIKTALSSVAYPGFLYILSLIKVDLIADRILISILGGIIAGVGISIVLRENASTGGTDVPCLIVHKYTDIPIHVLFTIIDGIIVVGGLVVYGLQDILIGLVYIYVSNLMINKLVVPNYNSAIALFVISEKKDEICDYIHNSLNRGTTLLNAKGGYTKQEKEVILTVVSNKQYANLVDVITKIDEKAFVIVSDAKDMKGEGFTYEYRV